MKHTASLNSLTVAYMQERAFLFTTEKTSNSWRKLQQEFKANIDAQV